MFFIKSLGLIEVIGLVVAIEAADAATKSANVDLIGYEFAKGDGMVMIKLEGEVSAVKAAVDAGKMAAQKIGTVVSTLVIPRPADGLDCVVLSKETVGLKKTEPEVIKEEVIKEEVIVEEKVVLEEIIEEIVPEIISEEIMVSEQVQEKPKSKSSKKNKEVS